MSDNEAEEEKSPIRRDFFKPIFTAESIIKVVQDYPCIWNRSMPEYRDKVRRQLAWEEIYRRMEPSYDEMSLKAKNKIGQQISKKWFNLRDAYLKSKKDKNRKPYIYKRYISYLDPFLILDKSNEETIYLEEDLLDEESENMKPSFVYIDEERDEEQETPRKKSRYLYDVKKENDYEVNDSSIISEFNKTIERENDAERAFFTSVVPIVKELSAEAKLEFQIQVLKLLKNIKKRDESGEGFD